MWPYIDFGRGVAERAARATNNMHKMAKIDILLDRLTDRQTCSSQYYARLREEGIATNNRYSNGHILSALAYPYLVLGTSPPVSGRLKMRDMNLRHQIAGVENARHKNAGPNCRGGKCWKSYYGKPKCEKVSQSSCICVHSYSFSISLLDK